MVFSIGISVFVLKLIRCFYGFVPGFPTKGLSTETKGLSDIVSTETNFVKKKGPFHREGVPL